MLEINVVDPVNEATKSSKLEGFRRDASRINMFVFQRLPALYRLVYFND